MNLKAGTVLQNGQYIIEATLGRGAFGITYRATETYLNRPVAIATLNASLRYHADFERFQKQFIATAFHLQKCQHPNVVRVFDCFEDEGLYYVVMEYIPGQTLAEQIRSGQPLPEGQAIHYIRQIGSALSQLHHRGFLHRDVKPQNIIRRQGTNCVVLTNFGIACEFTPRVARTYASLLSAGYAAIEQYIPQAPRTPATDIYALAGTLYYLLTGQPPVAAPVRDRFPLKDWRQFQPTLSKSVERAIRHGLEIEAHRRPQTVEAWLALLEESESCIVIDTSGSLTTVELKNPSAAKKPLKSGETEGLLAPCAQECETTEVRRRACDRSPENLLAPACQFPALKPQEDVKAGEMRQLVGARSPENQSLPTAAKSTSKSPNSLKGVQIRAILKSGSQPRLLLPPAASPVSQPEELKDAAAEKPIKDEKAEEKLLPERRNFSGAKARESSSAAVAESEKWPADENLLVDTASSSAAVAEKADELPLLKGARMWRLRLNLSEKVSTIFIPGNRDISKRWIPISFALTAAIASLVGAGCGLAIRFSKVGQPGSTIFHTEQSFPPLKDWPGSFPLSDEADANSPSPENNPDVGQPPLADWLSLPEPQTDSEPIETEPGLNAQPEPSADSDTTYQSETAPLPENASESSDAVPEPIASEAESSAPFVQSEYGPDSQPPSENSPDWVRSPELSHSEPDAPDTVSSPELLDPDSAVPAPEASFDPAAGIL